MEADAVAGGESRIDLSVRRQNRDAILNDAVGNRLADRDLLIVTVTMMDHARLQVALVVVQHEETTIRGYVLEHGVHHAGRHFLGLSRNQSFRELGQAAVTGATRGGPC